MAKFSKQMTWADLVADKDYEYAFSEILQESREISEEGAAPLDLAAVLVEAAMQTLDYTDPWNYGAEYRCLRLKNFTAYVAEYTDKRLALLHTTDGWLAGRMEQYRQGRTVMPEFRRHSGRSMAAPSIDARTALTMLAELKDDLYAQGVPPPSIARGFIDAAFVFARIQPVDAFIQFCMSVKGALGQNVALPERYDFIAGDKLSQARHVPGSASIH